MRTSSSPHRPARRCRNTAPVADRGRAAGGVVPGRRASWSRRSPPAPCRAPPSLDRAQRVELVGTDAAAAMLHAGHQEQPHARLRLLPAMQRPGERLVEHDRARRRNRRVTGAMIDDHLAPLLDERQQFRGILGLARAHRVVDHRHQLVAGDVAARIDIERRQLRLRPKPQPVNTARPDIRAAGGDGASGALPQAARASTNRAPNRRWSNS